MNFKVLEFARLLEATPRSTLVVKRLETMEICGTGEGDSWVGYRQQLGFHSNTYKYPSARGYEFRKWERSSRYIGGIGPVFKSVGRPPQDIHRTERFAQVGSTDVLPAVRAIEALIESLRQAPKPFLMNVNTCEECRLFFAQFLPYDGIDASIFDGDTYGLHTCMLCNKSRFLCLECVAFSYHYCAEEQCKACICVDRDGGRSVRAVLASDQEAWAALQQTGTTHFKTMECCWESHDDFCKFPTYWKIVCKDEATCDRQDVCGHCGGNWECPLDFYRLGYCRHCERRTCLQGCVKFLKCTTHILSDLFRVKTVRKYGSASMGVSHKMTIWASVAQSFIAGVATTGGILRRRRRDRRYRKMSRDEDNPEIRNGIKRRKSTGSRSKAK